MAVLLVSFSSAFAATLTWDGGGGAIPANWFDLGNWDAPNNLQLDHDLVFGTGFDSGTSILIGHVSGAPANTITINTTTGFTINGLFSGGFRPIHLATGQLSRVDVAGTESNHIINTTVNLESNGVWNINGSGLLSVKSIDESGGSFSLQKTGTGTLVLSEAGGYTGGTTVSTGALRAQSNTSLGSGAVSVATGAALELDSALVNLPLTLNGAGISSGGALRAHAGVNSWSGGITLNTNSTIGVSSGASLSISGVITDGGLTRTLTKTGLGTLTLSNANTIDGNTTVSEGPLWLADNLALGPSNIVTVADN
jgi:fibronectin-binding autotransporter adhesin